jgi:hypothetical protein
VGNCCAGAGSRLYSLVAVENANPFDTAAAATAVTAEAGDKESTAAAEHHV